MFSFLLSLLTGSGGIAGSLEKAYRAKLDAQNDSERLRAEHEIKILEAEQDARRQAAQIRRETAGHIEVRLAVGIIGLATAAHYAAVVADSIFIFSWNVAKLPAPMDQWEGAIILSFFGLQGAVGIGSAIIRRIGK